jgi:hypothetical protein
MVDRPSDENESRTSQEGNARSCGSHSEFHRTDEELLRETIECPRLLDSLCNTPGERHTRRETLGQWKQLGYPPLKSLREESSCASAQALIGTAQPFDPSRADDTGHFYQCQACGEMVDKRQLEERRAAAIHARGRDAKPSQSETRAAAGYYSV